MLPQLSAYQEAVQHPEQAFADSELRQALPDLDAFGLPKPRSGNMAVVFRLRGAGGDWAVRCFQRLMPGQGERYAAIAHHVRAQGLPYFVPFAYQAQGILVDGGWQPIVKMGWARGERLDRYLHRHLGDHAGLEELARNWLGMLRALEQARIAHGDLQHGNVLIDGGRLMLVDYDGMFVPALAGRPALELGHPNYQHPRRGRDDVGPWLDRFSGWLIYLSIAAFACRPELWQQQGAGDECLLFRREDLLDPNARIWHSIDALGRPGLTRLAQSVRDAAAGPPAQVPALPWDLSLTDVLAEAAPRRSATPPPVQRQRPGALASGPLPTWVAKARAFRPAEPPPFDDRLGSAAQWLLPAADPAPRPRIPPGSRDRLVAAFWLPGLAVSAWLAPSSHGVWAAVLAPWTAVILLLLHLRFRRRSEVRRSRHLADEAGRLRREGAAAQAALDAARQAREAATTELGRQAAGARQRREALADLAARRLDALRRACGLDAYGPRLAELRSAAAEAKARRLQALRREELRRILEGHRVMDDPLLDIRRGARLQLLRAGVLSAYDLQSVGDRLVVDRHGLRHYVDAIGPERAERIASWHRAVSRAARAQLPSWLPPQLAAELDLDLRRAVRDLRRRRHEAVRRFVTGARAMAREASRGAAAARAEEEGLRRPLEAEADRLLSVMQAMQATLRQVRWHEARIAAERERLRDIRFGLFLRDLLRGGRPRTGP